MTAARGKFWGQKQFLESWFRGKRLSGPRMLDREPKNDLHEQKGLHTHCRAGSTNAYNLSAKKINTVALLCATEFYLFFK